MLDEDDDRVDNVDLSINNDTFLNTKRSLDNKVKFNTDKPLFNNDKPIKSKYIKYNKNNKNNNNVYEYRKVIEQIELNRKELDKLKETCKSNEFFLTEYIKKIFNVIDISIGDLKADETEKALKRVEDKMKEIEDGKIEYKSLADLLKIKDFNGNVYYITSAIKQLLLDYEGVVSHKERYSNLLNTSNAIIREIIGGEKINYNDQTIVDNLNNIKNKIIKINEEIETERKNNENKLKEYSDTFQSEKESIKNEYASKIESNEAKIKELEDNLINVKSEKDLYKGTFDSLKDEIKKLEHSNKILKDDIATKSCFDNCDNVNKDLKEESKKNSAKINELEDNLLNKRIEMDKLQTDNKELENEMIKKIEEYKKGMDEYETLKREFEALKKDNSNMKIIFEGEIENQASILKEQEGIIKRNEERISNLDNDLKSKIKEIEKLEKDYYALKESNIIATESKIPELELKIIKLKGENEILTNQLERLEKTESELNNVKGENDKLKKENKNLKNANKELSESVKQSTRHEIIKKLDEAIDSKAYKAEIDILKVRESSMINLNALLEKRLEEYKNQLVEQEEIRKNESSKHQEAINALKAEIEKINQQVYIKNQESKLTDKRESRIDFIKNDESNIKSGIEYKFTGRFNILDFLNIT